jgi:hypothetical protein
MMLRTARRYDYSSDTIIFANNRPYTRDNYSIAGVGDSADPLFNFCRHLCVMKVDNAEYALLTAIVIFSGNFLHKTLNPSFLQNFETHFKNYRTPLPPGAEESRENPGNLP